MALQRRIDPGLRLANSAEVVLYPWKRRGGDRTEQRLTTSVGLKHHWREITTTYIEWILIWVMMIGLFEMKLDAEVMEAAWRSIRERW